LLGAAPVKTTEALGRTGLRTSSPSPLCGDRHLVAFADATLDFLPHDRAAAYVGEQTGLSLYGAAVSCPGG
jgi:hypothetical protein